MREQMEQVTLWPDTTQSGAIMDQQYRYLLWHIWDAELPRILYVLLNPSTATAHADDPTLRRCIAFAKVCGAGSLELVNLYAFRSPDPKTLRTTDDPVGPLNDETIRQCTQRSTMIICGWGACPWAVDRANTIFHLLRAKPLYCFGKTMSGMPKHPLYLPIATSLEVYP